MKLLIDKINAPCVRTKPLHNLQRILKTNYDGSILVDLLLAENYELHRLLLGFSCGLKVISQEKIEQKMKEKVWKSLENYNQKEINDNQMLLLKKDFCKVKNEF